MVQNATARLLTGTHKFDYISSALCSLHLLFELNFWCAFFNKRKSLKLLVEWLLNISVIF